MELHLLFGVCWEAEEIGEGKDMEKRIYQIGFRTHVLWVRSQEAYNSATEVFKCRHYGHSRLAEMYLIGKSIPLLVLLVLLVSWKVLVPKAKREANALKLAVWYGFLVMLIKLTCNCYLCVILLSTQCIALKPHIIDSCEILLLWLPNRNSPVKPMSLY